MQSCRGGTAWDKQHGVGVERRRLLARTREAVARGLLASNLWHSASHAEHARPMLQARANVLCNSPATCGGTTPEVACYIYGHG